MSREAAVNLRDQLAESGVNLTSTPRGFAKERGVPDSVIWVEPTAFSAHRMFPILVELEGRLFNVDDFEKFARRTSEDEPYQHHLNLVSLERIRDPIELSLTYDVGSVGHRLLSTSSGPGLEEGEFHDALRDWAEEHESTFHTSARITVLHGTRIVWWKLSFAMYGHHFETEIPFVVDLGDQFSKLMPLYASRMVIPAIAVTTDEDSHKKKQSQYSTSVHFRRVPQLLRTVSSGTDIEE